MPGYQQLFAGLDAIQQSTQAGLRFESRDYIRHKNSLDILASQIKPHLDLWLCPDAGSHLTTFDEASLRLEVLPRTVHGLRPHSRT